MPEALASLPQITDQHRFNAERWQVLLRDPSIADLDHHIETDAFGQVIMMPCPGFSHSSLQANALSLLTQLLPHGRAQPECPLSTLGGVKGIDVIWISDSRLAEARQGELLIKAPEVCLEIASPSNTRESLTEKKRLYFESGANEVWICDLDGNVSFYLRQSPGTPTEESVLCPAFPKKLEV
jgi:Uma2 family endonuclease